jgi:hypothetical protein
MSHLLGGIIMLIKVSIVIDIDTTDADIEDLRDTLLEVVIENASHHPQEFQLEPLNPSEES